METVENSSKRPFEDQSSEDGVTISSKKLCQERNDLNESTAETLDPNNSVNSQKHDEASVPYKAPFVGASEHDVGITEYVSDSPGFYAVLKERYSDFLVNEIDTEGNVVRLTNLSKPRNPECDYEVDDLLDEETIRKMDDLVAKKLLEVTIEVTDKDKNERKNLHVALRKLYQGIESCTEDRAEKKFVIVKNANTTKGRRFKPSVGGNYLHFVLYKENRDTMDVINKIASFLRVQPKVFSYAGCKDKRGKTSQLASAYRINPEKLLSINKQFNMIKVGNIVYKNEHLKLGDLQGNQFIMILRQLDGDTEVVAKAVNSLKTKGFINYYGLQRFGTSTIRTHTIGRSLLLGDWKGAINLILTPRTEDDSELVTAKTIWTETNDANKALENLKRKWSIEAKLLSGLASGNKNDLFNAFNAIPRNMRLMYIHSYQSYIWNKVASKRIKKHGLTVLAGDLVPKEADVLEDNYEADAGEDNRKAVLSRMVKVLSEADVEKYNISDVLLPLPGHSVRFPDNETKDWYDDFLKEDGMSWSNLDSKIKSYSLSGAYRKLILIPQDTKWEIIQYSDFVKPLALSDLDILQDEILPPASTLGSLKALKLEFKLPSSSYATMAVREVLKQSS